MDPSLSLSSDPHHTPHASYPTSNSFVSGPVSASNNPYFGGPPGITISNNNHVFQPQPQPQPQLQLHFQPQLESLAPDPNVHPVIHPLETSGLSAYPGMICQAIAVLKEPEGSSETAISRHIERNDPDLHVAHEVLLTHYLERLTTCGLLVMANNSYRFAPHFPLDIVNIAASAASSEIPNPEILPTDDTVNEQGLFDMVTASSSASTSASVPQKRGRGRPPKPKPGAQQPIAHANGLPSLEQDRLTVTNPTEEVQVTVSAKRGPGRPRKDGSGPISRAGVSGVMKQRGRPPGSRAAGRQKKPVSVSATAFVNPDVANGARRRGRSSMAETSDTVVAPAGAEVVAVAPTIKRGRGRPPKIGGVVNRIITKPKRGRGRPRKNATRAVTGAAAPQDTGYEELKKKFDHFQEKALEIVNVLRAEIASNDPVVLEAIMNLEELTTIRTIEPEVMEEVQPEDVPPHTEDAPQTKAETQGMEPGQEREAGEQTKMETQTQTEAGEQTQI